MMRRLSFSMLALTLGLGLGLAAADDVKTEVKKGTKATKHEVGNDVHGAFHDADGTVKSVSANGFVLLDEKGKELSFEVNSDTTVHAKGASHKMNKLDASGKPPVLTEFLSASQRVSVRYSKPEDRMIARDVKVKP